jgi:hypothetical protein
VAHWARRWLSGVRRQRKSAQIYSVLTKRCMYSRELLRLCSYVLNAFLICHAPAPVQTAFLALPQETYGVVHSSCDDFSGPALLEDVGFGPSPPSYLKSMDFRIDHTFGAHLSGFLRFGNTPSGSQSSLLLTATDAKLSNQSLTLGLDGQISSQGGNEFRFGWARTGSSTASSLSQECLDPCLPPRKPAPIDLPAALGSPGASSDTRGELYMRIAGIGDTSAWTDGGTNALRQIEVRDTFSLQRGSHLIRAGFDARNLHSVVRPLPRTIEADYLSANSVPDFEEERAGAPGLSGIRRLPSGSMASGAEF